MARRGVNRGNEMSIWSVRCSHEDNPTLSQSFITFIAHGQSMLNILIDLIVWRSLLGSVQNALGALTGSILKALAGVALDGLINMLRRVNTWCITVEVFRVLLYSNAGDFLGGITK